MMPNFKEFTDSFDFTAVYKTKELYISNARFSKEDEDIQALSRFIIEKAAGKERSVKFTKKEILDEVNWADRFRTTFNHDLKCGLATCLKCQFAIEGAG